MIGDNIYIHIELSEFKNIVLIRQELISILKKSTNCISEFVKENGDSNTSYDEIIINYENDYNVPANFFISYIDLKDQKAKEISISGFNHPAGEFLFENGVFLCKEISKINFVKISILTNDSIYSTEEIFKKYNNLLVDIGAIYTNVK